MPRERSGIDYTAVADAPGAIPKPRAKRDRAEGRTTGNSTLRTYTTLKTHAPINPVNHERRAERHGEGFAEQAQACREIGICCCCGQVGITEPHHYVSRGAGGTDEHCVPMLHEHHMRAHSLGAVTFWREVGIDPADVAYGMAEWVRAGCPKGCLPWGR